MPIQSHFMSSVAEGAPAEVETVAAKEDKPKAESVPELVVSAVRLNKFLAHNGVSTRRQADELIEAGKVRVNGTVVTQVGTRIQPDTDVVTLDGKPITAARVKPELFIMHKLKGELVSSAGVDARDRDVRQRKAAAGDGDGDAASKMALLDRAALMGLPRGLIAVGGLDYNASGVQLLTTSTAVATALEGQAAAGQLMREYETRVYGSQARRAVRALRAGGSIREVGRVLPCEITVINARDKGKAADAAGASGGAGKGAAAKGGKGTAADADRRGWSTVLPGSADADAIAALTGGAIAGDPSSSSSAAGGARAGAGAGAIARSAAEEDALLGDDEKPRTVLLRIRSANSVSALTALLHSSSRCL